MITSLRVPTCREGIAERAPSFFFFNFILLSQAVGSRAELLSFLAYLLAQKLDIGTHGVAAYRRLSFFARLVWRVS